MPRKLTMLLATTALIAATTSANGDTNAATASRQPLSLDDRLAACAQDPRVLVGVVSVDVCVGADLFFREEFAGNGRSCATCHRVDNNFTIDVPFIAKLPPDDSLFVAEFEPTLADLEIPKQMRARGLILENADGVLPDPRERFVLRSVPHNFSMNTSVTRAPGDTVNPPADRTGWSGDGAPNAGKLRDFQSGAIFQHYTTSLARVAGKDFRLASPGELDRIDLFMRELGRTNELNLAEVKMSDPDADIGRVTFLSAGARCNGCHVNAGANAGFGGGGNRNFNTGVESARNAALAKFPIDGGFGREPNPDGSFSFGDGTFNTPPLIEAADTGPFFHTDTTVSRASAHNTKTATSIEEAVAFYDSPAFNNSPAVAAAAGGAINLDEEQIDDIGRFLRAVNAAFNAQLALKRLDAARVIVDDFGNDHLATQRKLLRLANVEVQDAIEVLGGAPGLNTRSRLALVQVRQLITEAANLSSPSELRVKIAKARAGVSSASGQLGDNLSVEIGEGTVMF